MLTFREIQSCPGYYYHVHTGAVLRVVGSVGDVGCWTRGSWVQTDVVEEPDAPEFELLTPDVDTPFSSVEQEVQDRYGRAPTEIWNRQTAVQPDGSMVTEETELTARPVPERSRTSI